MGTQNWTPILCPCTMSQDNGPPDRDPPYVTFIEFVNICAVHAVAVAADPRAAYDTVFKESTDHSLALRAIVNTELDKQWPGLSESRLTNAIQRLEDDGDISSDPLDLLVVNPVLAAQRVRMHVVLNSEWVMNADRTEVFDVRGQRAENTDLDAAIETEIGGNNVTTVPKVARSG